jgi:hypothetical protein
MHAAVCIQYCSTVGQASAHADLLAAGRGRGGGRGGSKAVPATAPREEGPEPREGGRGWGCRRPPAMPKQWEARRAGRFRLLAYRLEASGALV